MATKSKASAKKRTTRKKRTTVKKPARRKPSTKKRTPAKKKPTKSAARTSTKSTASKKAPSRTAPTSASMTALSKKVATVSSDTKSLTKDFKSIVKIFGDNQKILVSMKGMIDDLLEALDTIQKQSKKINSIESDTQKMFEGFGQMRAHGKMISQLDSQATKLKETVRAMDERTRVSGGIENISKKISANHDSIKNNAQMIIKIGRHLDKIRDGLGSTVRPAAINSIHSEITNLKALFEEAQSKHKGDQATLDQISSLSEKMAALSQIPTEISSVQKHLQNLSTANNTLAPIVDELQGQLSRVASKVDSAGSLDSVKSEFASLRDEVLGRASKVDEGLASVKESLGRSEKSTTEFHQKADDLFSEMKSIKDSEERTSTDSTGEVMALLRLSEFQSNVRMTAESKYGEVADLEAIASQTVDVLNVFDKLAVKTSSDVRLPQGVKQWAVSKILECSDRWEIRFSDVLEILQEKLGVKLMRDTVRISQVREIFGTRAVDEIQSVLAEG